LAAEGLELLYSLADPLRLDAIDHLQHLPVELEQLGTRLPEVPVGIGPLPNGFELFGTQRDVLGPWAATIGEYLAGMQVALDASAVGLSATPPERVERTGQEGLSLQDASRSCRRFSVSSNSWARSELRDAGTADSP